MSSTYIEPDLPGLLNQFEEIGGPEQFGPEGLAIILTLWRKSSKLGWMETFQMTNSELQLKTGIMTRKTLNVYRNKLVEAKLIEYDPPPRGSSRGSYTVSFNLLGGAKAVTSGNHFGNHFTEVDTKVVTSGNHFAEVVTSGNHFGNTVLKDTITTTTSSIGEAFENVFSEFCVIHGKLDVQVKRTDVTLMQWFISKGVSDALIIKVMRQLYQERTADGAHITTFSYYKNAILDAWETAKAITDGVPVPAVALGEESITGSVPIGVVALGKQSPRSYRTSKYDQEMDELRMAKEEAKRLANAGGH